MVCDSLYCASVAFTTWDTELVRWLCLHFNLGNKRVDWRFLFASLTVPGPLRQILYIKTLRGDDVICFTAGLVRLLDNWGWNGVLPVVSRILPILKNVDHIFLFPFLFRLWQQLFRDFTVRFLEQFIWVIAILLNLFVSTLFSIIALPSLIRQDNGLIQLVILILALLRINPNLLVLFSQGLLLLVSNLSGLFVWCYRHNCILFLDQLLLSWFKFLLLSAGDVVLLTEDRFRLLCFLFVQVFL